MLPATGPGPFGEGDKGGTRCLAGPVVPGLGSGHPNRRGIGIAGDVHGSGSGGDDEVRREVARLRAVLTKRRDGDVDQRGVDLGEVVVPKTAGGHRAGLIGFDEDVGGGGEAAQVRLSFWGVEVELDAAPVAGVSGPVEGLLTLGGAVEERWGLAGRGAAGRLDQNHIGAQVGEDVAAEQPALIGEVEHAVGAKHRGMVAGVPDGGGGASGGALAGSAAAVELGAVAIEFEAGGLRVLLDGLVEGGVAELGYRAALAADQVVVVAAAAGALVADASVLKGDAADDVELIEELDGAKDGRPPDVGKALAQLLDGEGPIRARNGLKNSAAGSGQAVARIFQTLRRALGGAHGSDGRDGRKRVSMSGRVGVPTVETEYP